MTKYLLGYAVGYILSDGGECLVRDYSKPYIDNTTERDTKLFQTADKAKEFALKLAKDSPDAKWFYRPYSLEVPQIDPEYHKKHYSKLKLLSEAKELEYVN